MLVKELIEILEILNPDSKIYLSIDPEGNGYNELYNVDGDCVYHEDEMYSLGWSSDDVCMEEYEWYEIKQKEKCVVLSP